MTPGMDGVTQPPPPGGDDADRWREAGRLRREHAGWVVIWLARLGQYRAYPLVHARRGTALTASTPAGLAALISQAEQAARRPPASRRTPRARGGDRS
jgi:hypothetical protein